MGAVVPPPLAVGGHAQEMAKGMGDGTTGVVAAVVEAAATEKTTLVRRRRLWKMM